MPQAFSKPELFGSHEKKQAFCAQYIGLFGYRDSPLNDEGAYVLIRCKQVFLLYPFI